MRNRWGIEIRKGFGAVYRYSDGRHIEGVIVSIDKTSDYAKAYGPLAQIRDEYGSMPVSIDEIIRVTPPPKANPLTRTTVAADSQRPRASKTAKGRPTKTKAPSRRLMGRRRATEAAPEGFYGNPLSRVKINSPSMATGAPPSERLKKRRRKTAREPMPGIYANPKKKDRGPFYYLVESVPKGYFDLSYLSSHYTEAEVIKLAQAKADKYGVQAKIRQLHL